MLVLSEKIVGYSVDFLLMRSFATFLFKPKFEVGGEWRRKIFACIGTYMTMINETRRGYSTFR